MISIRVIVTSVALTITSVAMLGVGAVAERNARRALTREVETRLLLEARNLARASSVALLSEFPELTLHPLIKELQAERGELGWVAVVDHQGRIQGHADPRRLGTNYEPPPKLEPSVAQTVLNRREAFLVNDEILVVSVPVSHSQGRLLGTVWVGLRREYVDNLIAQARSQVMLILSIALALGVIATFTIMTWLLRPVDTLREGLERIGRGDLETPLSVRDRTELGMLAEAVNSMATELKDAQTVLVEKERLSHELELAREIQRSLLPIAPIRAGAFLVDGTQQPAAEVGGDYYDFFPLAGGKVGVAVADVAGKGLAGCVVMSMLSALLRAFKDSYPSPSKLLAELDAKLTGTLRPGTFVTMFYGILDPQTGVLTYASAAHCPTLIYRRATAKVELERPTGIPIGAIRGGKIRSTLADRIVRLEPGDLLLQYTDGVNETFEPTRQEQFGFERMRDVVAARAAEGWPALLTELRRRVGVFRAEGAPEDDETLLVVCHEDAEAMSARPDAASAEAPNPEDRLALARTSGEPLSLHARLEELSELRRWLDALPDLEDLEEREFAVLATALYEACANIVEHGCDNDPAHTLEVWKVPGPEIPVPDRNLLSHHEFVIVDQGRPFSADNWEESDFDDPQVRRQGRGFGLDIIHRAMIQVEYRSHTPGGNVTLLVFDPAKHGRERKLRYA